MLYDGLILFPTKQGSELAKRRSELTTLSSELKDLLRKFEENKEASKMNIERSAQIGRMKKQYASLSKSIPTLHDTNTFINLVNTEAKRLGLKVISFRRSGSNPRTMITEHNYDFKFQGTYAHYVLLLNRISLSKNLVSVLNLDLAPGGKNKKSDLMLEGTLTLQAYQLSKKGAGL